MSNEAGPAVAMETRWKLADAEITELFDSLDENGDGNSGWVQYDMHGIQFAMKFTVGPKRQ